MENSIGYKRSVSEIDINRTLVSRKMYFWHKIWHQCRISI